ncbi:helix-turn-helix domain-containing protein [Tsukamurella sp. 8F]|uniref:winged helix-turn-helix transcriptional regulator n=1 Tax=Tsukamurella sp. 8F TaxID=3031961 RepID=UPI0023B8A49D|nr:helix-turn-helix domain-containing protein [Tsukamurella sp. 8F]MDF0586085.1 helix-turn-helix domain-containing protein [Tsukamurella sp. 8F]
MATATAAEIRDEQKREYNAYLRQCPSRALLDQLSNKWVTLVIAALANGPKRYSEIARIVAGVSQKMLTQTLRTLERDGLIHREVEPTVPVTVTYSLTDLGWSLREVVLQLKVWAEANMPEVDAARVAYDTASG